MNINYKKLCIIFSLIFLFNFYSSCNLSTENYEKKEAIDFQTTLKAEIQSFGDEAAIFSAYQILNVDNDYLIISDSEENGFFKVFNLPDLKYLYSWGTSGKGPDEFEYIPLFGINVDGKDLHIYDIGTRLLRIYTVTDSTLVSNGSLSLSYKGQTNIHTSVSRVKDNLYVAEYGKFNKDEDYEYIALAPNNESFLFKFGQYPESELDSHDRFWYYLKSIAASPDGSKIAAFYLKHNLFKIFDSNGNELLKARVVDNFVDYKIRDNNEIETRSLVWASDAFLYALGIHKSIDNEEYSNTSIEVWNWKGYQVYRAYFDRPISDFTVDEERKKVYGYSSQSIHELFEYDLPVQDFIKY